MRAGPGVPIRPSRNGYSLIRKVIEQSKADLTEALDDRTSARCYRGDPNSTFKAISNADRFGRIRGMALYRRRP